jgi:hypothetical protein
MTDGIFGLLEEIPPRDAWKHEAKDFTPWLAENISQIGDAIGFPLELTGQEVPVETFAADILARNPADDSLVLIENQLEQTDHTHLGQIMTYLAGLDVRTVIWIAPTFREPHLSAIRWLNQHTADDFSFLAIRVRVVRIGDSPLAPVFEVVEKPNGWERLLKDRAVSDGASYYDIKQEFWQALITRHDMLEGLGVRVWRYPNNYVVLWREPQIELSVWIGKSRSGAFVRSAHSAPFEPVLEFLEPWAGVLSDRLDTDFGPHGKGDHCLAKSLPKGHEHKAAWPEIMDWMRQTVDDYRRVFSETLDPVRMQAPDPAVNSLA